MSDQSARLQALQTDRSFIVQAPAGSGKTELLIQRYLSLLAQVDLPEQIIAITFTRKAAAEMRGRILRALREATSERAPRHEHEARTRRLARGVLDRDRKLQWGVRDQPQRLRIDTVDALNAWLARQLPVLSGAVAGANIVEDARVHYRHAAQRTVGELRSGGGLGGQLQTLLQRLDNDLPRLEVLLADMLPRRDQWLRYLALPGEDELRDLLEQALERLVNERLRALADGLPAALRAELAALAAHAARSAEDAELRRQLEPWLTRTEPPPAQASFLGAWKGVARLLLIQKGTVRKRITTEQGFGPADPDARARMHALLSSVQDDEALRERLDAVRELPDPRYDSAQWRVLGALRALLRHLAAELRVIFAERNVVDFVELALAAQDALGRVDAPSELLLALDRRVRHILVDEFQDTSHTQLRLLELLTAGWEPGDARTLFLVGDPMQSIYRFRDADMSLFLKVKRRGLGNVPMTSLQLSQNFRSSPAIVRWVNASFSVIFPVRDELGSGAARFHPCEANRIEKPQHQVCIHALRGSDPRAELDRVMEILEEETGEDRQPSIGILVRSRSHLTGLHEQLRARGLQVHAVEIDAPNRFQVVQDLIGLTRALTHLGDRIAWLGVLRAPWCGLPWTALHALCANEPRRTVWELMNDSERLAALDADAGRRLAHVRSVLDSAFCRRAEQPLVRWVERTWLSLRGPACLDFSDELAQAERFFSLLEPLASRGDLDDPTLLDDLLSEPQAQGDPPTERGIEIMTIHRAKGLEFDTVVLLGLGREPRSEDSKALYWMERVAEDGRDDLLMAPMTDRARGEDALTLFVKRAERERDRAERARLLYVATTRARNRLHLVTQLSPAAQSAPGRSLAAWLWPQLAPEFQAADSPGSGGEGAAEDGFIQPILRRLSEGYEDRPPSAGTTPVSTAARPEFLWAGQTAIQVGTVVHQWLQRICEETAETWSPGRVRGLGERFRRELELLGVDAEDLNNAAERVVRALSDALEDPRGRWVLGAHAGARSEHPLTVLGESGLEHLRLDRTFVDEDGARWIIDFKTSEHEGGSVEAFLDSEVARYRPQLERYAAAVANFDDRPIRLGLYFPLLRAFRDWVPEPSR